MIGTTPSPRRLRAGALLLTGSLLAMTLAALPAAATLPPEATGDELAAHRAIVAATPVAPLPAAIGSALLAAVSATPKDPVIAGIATFYSERDNTPAFTAGGRPTSAATEALARIARAEEDGLDPADFPVPDPDLGTRGPEPAAAIADAEITIARAIVGYAREAQAGRMKPSSVSRIITLVPETPDPVAVLRRVSAASDVEAALEAFNPPHEQFRRLKEALAAERARVAAAMPAPPAVAIPTGPSLALGMRDPRVEALRRRLDITAAGEDPTLYDAGVEEAVRTFQSERGLTPDGVLGNLTIRVLNGAGRPPLDRSATILVNMERWRWMPRDLGRAHVFVDIPGFTASVVRDGTVDYTTRIVVGTPKTATPVFSDAIRFIVVNPYWNVPLSIASREMLPAIRANPNAYFSRRNYEVVVDGRVVSPGSVAWNEATIRRVRIRQRPGDDNALGNIKFMFPNQHAVYLHDTPSKALFERGERAFSHGCVRVQDPLRFAEALLAEDSKLTVRRIERMIGGREARLDLERPMPVHLAYFTAFVGEDGRLSLRGDIYGYDGRMIRLWGAGKT